MIIEFQDKKTKNYKKGITPLEIASDISVSLRKKTLYALVNGHVHSLCQPINEEKAKIEFICEPNNNQWIDILNHSCAHLLAAALFKKFGNQIEFGFGPAIEEGFYYDFYLKNESQAINLNEISEIMKNFVKENFKFACNYYSENQLISRFKNDSLKSEIIQDLLKKEQSISVFSLINENQEVIFEDVCKGPHVEKTSLLQHFALISQSGAYWKNNVNNKQLIRIYGTCFPDKVSLEEHLKILALRKERDHRKIGSEMQLFTFDYLAGQGMPIWLPNGMIVKKEIKNFLEKTEQKYGFKFVQTPITGNLQLYKTSGHWQHYRENMFKEIELENETLVLRPMSCPHHCLVFNHFNLTYKDLPLRLAEEVNQFRYEKSGALLGLERVRSMHLTDAHIFARADQIENEINICLKLIEEILNAFKIKIFEYRLSTYDPNLKNAFHDDAEMWENSQSKLKEVLNKNNINFKEGLGDAAFYGPKIDIEVKTVLGHKITLATLQLDFLLPKKFNLTYTNINNEKQSPIIIHRGLIGTYERFLAILLEQTNGVLPFWLAPEQVKVISISEKYVEHAKHIQKLFIENEIRCGIDDRNETLNYKIQSAQTKKIPFQIIIGEKEQTQNILSIRKYSEKTTYSKTFQEIISDFKNLIVTKQ